MSNCRIVLKFGTCAVLIEEYPCVVKMVYNCQIRAIKGKYDKTMANIE